jgi:hypothetical protein
VIWNVNFLTNIRNSSDRRDNFNNTLFWYPELVAGLSRIQKCLFWTCVTKIGSVSEKLLRNTWAAVKQDRQCTHNLIFLRFSLATVVRFTVVDLDVGVNNIKVFSVATAMQQLVPFALLWATKYFSLLLTMLSIKYYECVCVCYSTSYSACKSQFSAAHYLWHVWLYHVLPHCFINEKIFETKI